MSRLHPAFVVGEFVRCAHGVNVPVVYIYEKIVEGRKVQTLEIACGGNSRRGGGVTAHEPDEVYHGKLMWVDDEY